MGVSDLKTSGKKPETPYRLGFASVRGGAERRARFPGVREDSV
jgi:hypothetical protein